MNNYLSDTEIAALSEAIGQAEKHSTGEIRIHVDSHTEGKNAQTAWEVFRNLGMADTKYRNAVLFHVNFQRHYLTIIGGEGIHEKVSQKFWNELHDGMTAGFAEGKFFETLRDAVLKTGLHLKKYFPAENDNPNELPNEITFS